MVASWLTADVRAIIEIGTLNLSLHADFSKDRLYLTDAAADRQKSVNEAEIMLSCTKQAFEDRIDQLCPL